MLNCCGLLHLSCWMFIKLPGPEPALAGANATTPATPRCPVPSNWKLVTHLTVKGPQATWNKGPGAPFDGGPVGVPLPGYPPVENPPFMDDFPSCKPPFTWDFPAMFDYQRVFLLDLLGGNISTYTFTSGTQT